MISLSSLVYKGTYTEVKTASFNAVKNFRYICDTNGGSFTATLPLLPSIGDVIEFVDPGDAWSTNNLVIAPNGLKINGATESLTCNTDNVMVTFTYVSVAYGWAVTLSASILSAAPHAVDSHTDWPSAVSMTEVGYLDGVTSGIQGQLNAKGTGDVTLTGNEELTNKTLTAPVINDPLVNGPTYTRDDDGTVSGGSWAIDYANGPVIKATAGANITSITMSNWPASGTGGHLRCMLVNFGAYTITFPSAWKWVKSDLTTTTTFGDLGVTLPSSGTAIADLFSDDGGTTLYATVLRG